MARVKHTNLSKPMLAKIEKKPFNGKGWVFETKYDGYRALALIDGKGNVELYSRNLLSFNKIYPPIVDELKQIKNPCLIDGEIVIEDKKGRSSFQLLQDYLQTIKGKLKYYVFDMLSLDGKDITSYTLLERKDLLELLIKKYNLKSIFYSNHINEKGISFYKQAQKKGLEGIIAKNGRSAYRVGKRSSDWLKIKIINEQELIIIGITQPKGSRKYFGSLVLGVYKDKELNYAGNCGTGFTEAALKDLYFKFTPLFVDESPLKEKIELRLKIQWMKPKLVCEVKFTEWTTDGSLRHPVFMGLRMDKKATEVVKE